jgi:enoyl-CoA hydratase
MIERSVQGEAIWIQLNRPEKMNALDLDGWKNLYKELERAADEARVAVLTGTDDVFCAGDDIETLDSMSSTEDVTELADRLHEVLFGIEELSIPVLTAVNGLAYGGGCEIVAASDIAVAVENASFALPETRIGAYPPFAAERLDTLGGKKRGMELILTGEPIDAEIAFEWGIINRVVPRAELEDTIMEYVDNITRSPAESTRLAKQYALSRKRDAGDRNRISGALAQTALSKDCQEATRAFLERNTGEK